MWPTWAIPRSFGTCASLPVKALEINDEWTWTFARNVNLNLCKSMIINNRRAGSCGYMLLFRTFVLPPLRTGFDFMCSPAWTRVMLSSAWKITWRERERERIYTWGLVRASLCTTVTVQTENSFHRRLSRCHKSPGTFSQTLAPQLSVLTFKR